MNGGKIMNFKKIATITMAALLAISSSMPASAVTKNWRVYHAQGAPTTSGIFDSGQLMPKGGSVCEVKMTGYENLSKTTLYAYRQGHKDARKYITAKEKIVNIYVDPNKTEKVIVHMSTTSSKQTTAKGTFMR